MVIAALLLALFPGAQNVAQASTATAIGRRR